MNQLNIDANGYDEQNEPKSQKLSSYDVSKEYINIQDIGKQSSQVTCGNCLRVNTYTPIDIHSRTLHTLRKKYRKENNIHLANNQDEAAILTENLALYSDDGNSIGINETDCHVCHYVFIATSRKIICVRCKHAFCSDHAPYTRTIPGLHGPRVCIKILYIT